MRDARSEGRFGGGAMAEDMILWMFFGLFLIWNGCVYAAYCY